MNQERKAVRWFFTAYFPICKCKVTKSFYITYKIFKKWKSF